MTTKGQTAKQLFQEYRRKTEEELNNYNRFMWVVSIDKVQHLERELWKVGVLAEVFGRVAGTRDGVDYIQNWREGK